MEDKENDGAGVFCAKNRKNNQAVTRPDNTKGDTLRINPSHTQKVQAGGGGMVPGHYSHPDAVSVLSAPFSMPPPAP